MGMTVHHSVPPQKERKQHEEGEEGKNPTSYSLKTPPWLPPTHAYYTHIYITNKTQIYSAQNVVHRTGLLTYLNR